MRKNATTGIARDDFNHVESKFRCALGGNRIIFHRNALAALALPDSNVHREHCVAGLLASLRALCDGGRCCSRARSRSAGPRCPREMSGQRNAPDCWQRHWLSMSLRASAFIRLTTYRRSPRLARVRRLGRRKKQAPQFAVAQSVMPRRERETVPLRQRPGR